MWGDEIIWIEDSYGTLEAHRNVSGLPRDKTRIGSIQFTKVERWASRIEGEAGAEYFPTLSDAKMHLIFAHKHKNRGNK